MLILSAFASAVLVFMVLPSVIIIPMSFSPKDYLEFPPSGFTLSWYAAYFEDSEWQKATLLSGQVAFLTAIVTSLVGTAATYAIVRGAKALRGPVQLLVIMPIIVPHVALAVGLYLFFQQMGLIGSMPAFVAAHTVLALPFFIFTVAASLTRIDPTLESAAMSCGANRLRAFINVTLPQIIPAILSGALFSFIISFDEPVISFFVSSVRDRTLPRRMFEDIEMSLTPIVPAIATMLTLLSIVILLVAYVASRRGRSAPPIH